MNEYDGIEYGGLPVKWQILLPNNDFDRRLGQQRSVTMTNRLGGTLVGDPAVFARSGYAGTPREYLIWSFGSGYVTDARR
jgi:hypothetical protein